MLKIYPPEDLSPNDLDVGLKDTGCFYAQCPGTNADGVATLALAAFRNILDQAGVVGLRQIQIEVVG